MVISFGLLCPKDPAMLAAIPTCAADNDHDDVERGDVCSRTREGRVTGRRRRRNLLYPVPWRGIAARRALELLQAGAGLIADRRLETLGTISRARCPVSFTRARAAGS
jgi:hypothetical protein